jgi:transcriptional regulator with XRE-family HTH domain
MEPARTDPARTLTSVPSQHSPLAAVRLRRRLTVEEAAKRAGITVDEATWLEEGRIYRFRSTDDALLACLVYATALDLDRREARELAGLPVPPKPLDVNPLARLIAVAALAALLSALAVAVTFSHFHLGSSSTVPRRTKRGPVLPAPWTIKVDVLNGSGDINYTRRVAGRIGALGYRIGRVARANRFDYTHTAVYYEPGGFPIALRLARQIGVVTSPLPGGTNPRRLVVIVGPHRGPS